MDYSVKNFSLRSFVASILMLLLVAPAVGSTQELAGPQRVIQSISDQLQVVLKRDEQRLKDDPAYVYELANEILVPHVDFARVSSLVLGKHWRRASAEQRTAFSKQFQRLLVRTYSTAFHEFKDWEIKYSPVRMAEGAKDISVQTEVLRSDAPPVAVVYRMHNRDGHWKAFDVKIEGISLITNYRSRFNKEVRLGGMERLIGLLTELNDRRVKVNSASSKKG